MGTLQGADRFDDAWFFFTAGRWLARANLPRNLQTDRCGGIAPLTPAATMTRRVDHVAVDHALRRAVPRRCLCQTTASTRGSSACLTTSACLVRLPPPTRQHACLTGTADTMCRGDPTLPFREELTGAAGAATESTGTRPRKFVALTECHKLVLFRTRTCSCDSSRCG